MFEVKVLESIDEIGIEVIDLLSNDGFFTYGWFKALEASKPFKIIPKYLFACQEGRAVALAPCFIQSSSQYFTLNELLWYFVFPGFNKLRYISTRLGFSSFPLVCYSPCSFHSRILLSKDSNERLVLDSILKTINEICKKNKILFSAFPFVSEFDKTLMTNLPRFGYNKIPLFYSTYLDIEWSSFEDYLKSLKSKVRRSIRREIKKNRNFGVIIEQKKDFNLFSSTLSELYANTYSKYSKKQNPLKPLFFEKLSEYAKGSARVFTAKKDNKIIGFCLCLINKNTMDAYLAGFDYKYHTKKDFTYFIVAYYSPIKAAIEEGIKRIHFRASTYGVKLKRGCKLEKTYLFVKCHSKPLNFLFSRYMKHKDKWIFPPRQKTKILQV